MYTYIYIRKYIYLYTPARGTYMYTYIYIRKYIYLYTPARDYPTYAMCDSCAGCRDLFQIHMYIYT